MMPARIIVTGANGAGKSTFAARLAALDPGRPLLSFDAMKLTQGWRTRPRAEVETLLSEAIRAPDWILEGGPSLLPIALPAADAVVWMDPPFVLRAWRLLVRPLANRGRTRPELPAGNPDTLLRQWRFGARSLLKDCAFRRALNGHLQAASCPVHRLRTDPAARALEAAWSGS